MLRVRHVIGYSMIVRNDAMTGECRQGDPQLGSCVPAGGASECGRYGVCCRWIVGDRILGLSPQNLVAMALSLTTNALVPLGSSAEALTRRLRPVFQSVRRRPAAHRPSVLIISPSKKRPIVRASALPHRSMGCAIRVRPTPSTTGRRSPSYRPPWGTPTYKPRALCTCSTWDGCGRYLKTSF